MAWGVENFLSFPSPLQSVPYDPHQEPAYYKLSQKNLVKSSSARKNGKEEKEEEEEEEEEEEKKSDSNHVSVVNLNLN
jgi:hypothetical protein